MLATTRKEFTDKEKKPHIVKPIHSQLCSEFEKKNIIIRIVYYRKRQVDLNPPTLQTTISLRVVTHIPVFYVDIKYCHSLTNNNIQ